MVADFASGMDGGICEQQPCAFPPEDRTHVKPFHFANAFRDFAQADTADKIAVSLSQKKAAFGWSIFARQIGEFRGEVLKAEVYPERVGILLEKLPHDRKMFCRVSRDYLHDRGMVSLFAEQL